jgi:hypothetical protein
MLVPDSLPSHDAGARERPATSTSNNTEGRGAVTQTPAAAVEDGGSSSSAAAAHMIICARPFVLLYRLMCTS